MLIPAPLKTVWVLLFSLLIFGCANLDLGDGQVSMDHPEAGILTLADGKQYAILPSEFSYTGSAAYTLPNGQSLQGQFVNGQLQGQGQESGPYQSYQGQWLDGRYHGEGKLTKPNGFVYEGPFVQGFAHGRGKEITPTGEYDGDFTQGNYHGHGTYKANTRHVYRGSWQNGQRAGFGQESHPNGSQYEGDWQKNHKHGFGQQRYPDGSRYRGAWQQGKRQGYGLYEDPRGVTYEGVWHNDSRHGYGEELHPDGNRYLGDWSEDKKHGQGQQSKLDGSQHAGEWIEGHILGPGERITTDGLIISGNWNGDVISHGLLVTPDQLEYAGPMFKSVKGANQGREVHKKLLAWLTAKSEAGSPYAQNFLASAYLDFVEPAPNTQVAQLWLEKAAQKNHAAAQNRLAILLAEQDMNSSLDWLRKAADQQHPSASQLLGEYFHLGHHVTRNLTFAVKYYQQAVDKGSVVAINNLAWLLATTTQNNLADAKRAIELISPIVLYLRDWQHLDTLAAAHARQGNWSTAVRMQQQVLKSTQSLQDANLHQELQHRLDLYQQKQPYLEP